MCVTRWPSASIIDAINARKTPHLPDPRERTCFVVVGEMLANKGRSAATSAAANMQLESLVALVAAVGSFPCLPDGCHL